MLHDTDRILKLAREAGLELAPGSLRLNDMGLDFQVAFGRDGDAVEWVLRMPRRTDVACAAVKEAKILDYFRSRLPVAVPDWKVFSDDLIAYPSLPGNPGLTFDASTYETTWHFDQNSPVYVETLGAALAQLHGLDTDDAISAGLSNLSIDAVRENWTRDLETVEKSFEVPAARLALWRAGLADLSFWPTHAASVHGDLYVGHVMVKSDGTVCGIIDWSEAHIGDPGIDLAGHLKVFGEASLRDLLGHYEAAGGQTWPRIVEHCKMLQSAEGIRYAMFALKTGSAEHLEGAQGLLSAPGI